MGSWLESTGCGTASTTGAPTTGGATASPTAPTPAFDVFLRRSCEQVTGLGVLRRLRLHSLGYADVYMRVESMDESIADIDSDIVDGNVSSVRGARTTLHSVHI